MTSRHYCFTSFDDEAPTKGSKVRYLVYQWEECPETKKNHWQGYAEFSAPVRLSAAKKELGLTKAHLEKRRGTREQARDYCMKEDSRLDGPYEEGTWSSGGQGKRNDVERVADMVKQGASEKDIAEEHPTTYMRMYRGIRELKNVLTEKRTWKPNVEVYWGPTGTGKSLIAAECYPNAFRMTDEKGWWDGYDGHEDVIIDDFRPGWWSLTNMLNLLDRGEMRVPIKCGSKQFVAKNIIITSNIDPRLWYTNEKQATAAIMRRINHCEKII